MQRANRFIYLLALGILNICSTSSWAQRQEEIIIEKNEIQSTCKYWGNSFSFKFHRTDCLFAQCMNRRHLIVFDTAQEAIAAHYAPCKYCWPPFSCEVHGVLLLPKVNNPPPEPRTSEKTSNEGQSTREQQ